MTEEEKKGLHKCSICKKETYSETCACRKCLNLYRVLGYVLWGPIAIFLQSLMIAIHHITGNDGVVLGGGVLSIYEIMTSYAVACAVSFYFLHEVKKGKREYDHDKYPKLHINNPESR